MDLIDNEERGVSMLYNMKEILKVADINNFAVPAFNISDYAMFNGIMDISEKMNSPVIIAIHPNELKHIGTDIITTMRKRICSSSIPAVIHLDHGQNFEDVMIAIRAGFTSVMIDASSLPEEENIEICKKVVEAAHSAVECQLNLGNDIRKINKDMLDLRYTTSYTAPNISVEGELGTIGVIEDGKILGNTIKYTEPLQAVNFVEKTGVDALAIAIGTAHGLYAPNQKPKLQIDRLIRIKQALKEAGDDIQLVLHGGSSNNDAEIEEAATRGISKINISSDIKIAYYREMRKVLMKGNNEMREPLEIEPPCIKAMEECAAQKIRLFHAEEKAQLY